MSSWIDRANAPDCDFPLENLPFGVARWQDGKARCVSAIGDSLVNLEALEASGSIDAGTGYPLFVDAALNTFMSAGAAAWGRVREQLTELLREGGTAKLRDSKALRAEILLPPARVTMLMPFRVAEYTDFYACRQHAFNVGSMFRGPDNALPQNWLHIPIGYNGRASTVVVSGTDVRRPMGQIKPPGADVPVFEPCQKLDFELELGTVVGTPSQIGEPVSVAEADQMIFGYVLLNDWSARDIQAWEYQPLGPFQAKAFATTISPWVVTAAAIAPFRVAAPAREVALLSYLRDDGPMHLDISLDVTLQPARATAATTITRTNARELYYSPAQQLAHHTSSGCAMNTGDLLGSGTISGATRESFGSLLEIGWGGQTPLKLDDGEWRSFLEDGDELVIHGYAQGDGHRIGFGACAGRILPALERR